MSKGNEFNLDLDKYISGRRGTNNIFSFLKRDNFQNKKDEIKQPSFFESTYINIIGFFSRKEEPIELIKEEIEEKQEEKIEEEIPEEVEEEAFIEEKPSFLSKILSFDIITNIFKRNENLNDELETYNEEQTNEEVVNKVYLYKPVINEEMKSIFLMTSNLIKKIPERDQLDLMKTKEYEIYLALTKRFDIKK